MLDDAGFPEAQIVASNDLDEHLIQSMHTQEAKITTWGIGTKLVTAYDQPALGAVYKLSALKNNQGEWEPRLKLSEQTLKVNTPGIQQVRRYFDNSGMAGDMIYDETIGISTGNVIYHPVDATKRKNLGQSSSGHEDLLKPVFRKGKLVYEIPDIRHVREKRENNICLLHSGIKRFENPHIYPVGLESGLHNMKMELILKLKKYE
jgi:nicotinate phosphoribosyltransferase